MKYVALKFQNWLFDKHFRFRSDCPSMVYLYVPFVDLLDKWLLYTPLDGWDGHLFSQSSQLRFLHVDKWQFDRIILSYLSSLFFSG